MTDRKVNLAQVLFEFVPQGRYVKVSAVDPVTGMEVSIVGAATAPQSTLKQLAKRKLEYVMTKQLGAAGKKDDNLI